MEKIVEDELYKLESINDEVKLVWKANMHAGNGIFQFDFFCTSIIKQGL
jgi:hypothetical protein